MFRKQQNTHNGPVDVASFWIPYSDLMAALLGIFALLLLVTIFKLGEPLDEVKKLLEEREAIVGELKKSLGEDQGVHVTDSGSIRLEGEILFGFDDDQLREDGKATLLAVMPEYLKALSGHETFKEHLDRILIEGHADPNSAFEDTLGGYLYNLDLSQRRAASVVEFLLSCDELVEYRSFMQKYFLASGRSSTDPVYDEITKQIDNARSRRIQIDFRMDDTRLVKELIDKVDIRRAGAP